MSVGFCRIQQASGFLRYLLAIALIASAVYATLPATAQASDWPKFRRGMWQFERTLELAGRYATLPKAHRVLYKQEITRCVDPSEAMREIFKPASIGTCRSASPEVIDNQYIFALRCDHMGPVRTVIIVDSDSAYTEVNELTVGHFPRTEMVAARRVGECGSMAESDTGAPLLKLGVGLISTR